MKPLPPFSGNANITSTVLHSFRLRLLKLILLCGSISIALIWLFETSANLVSPLDQVAYPGLLVIFVSCGIMLIGHPDWLETAEKLSFSTFATYIVIHAQPIPFTGLNIYTDASLAQWFPLVYTTAFFFLETRFAIRVSILIYLLVMVPNIANILLQSPTIQSRDSALLLVNMLCSHPVYIVLLSGVARLKTYLMQARAHADAMNAAANNDYLTGVSNRRAITQLLQQTLTRSQEVEEVLSLILLDLDHFKQVNDNYGHDVGDRLLVEVTSTLRQHLRTADTLGRWGGEEFMILANGIGSDEAAALAERLRSVVETHSFAEVKRITISLGVASSQANDTPELLVKRADDALYQAKQGGRNCVRVTRVSI